MRLPRACNSSPWVTRHHGFLALSPALWLQRQPCCLVPGSGIQISVRADGGPWGHDMWICLYCCITDYRNLVDQNNTSLFSYSSVGQKSKIIFTRLKSRCRWARAPFEGSRGKSVSSSFPSSRSCLHHWLVAASFICKASVVASSLWPLLSSLLLLILTLIFLLPS